MLSRSVAVPATILKTLKLAAREYIIKLCLAAGADTVKRLILETERYYFRNINSAGGSAIHLEVTRILPKAAVFPLPSASRLLRIYDVREKERERRRLCDFASLACRRK